VRRFGRNAARACIAASVTAVATLGSAGAADAQAATKWLCGPGVKNDPCRPALSVTQYDGWSKPDGRTTLKRDRDRGVDCFYVYPTVSDQKTNLATKATDPEIRSIALYQAALYSQTCRVYAPVYRQATVPALQAGRTTHQDYLTAYGDVEEAFAAFLKRIGPKRGFVLLGHSQGTYHLQRLVRRKIDNSAALRHRMVSAVLLGGNVTVRKGSDRGGVFKHIPTCKRDTQLRCAIAYSTFNETPPNPSLFGRGSSRVANFLDLPVGSNLESACTNPAALGSTRSTALRSVIPSAPFAPGTLIAAGNALLGLEFPKASTTFVESDGAFTGRCSHEGGAHVLRIASAEGTPVPNASPTPEWGLHLVDANIAQRDLLDVVRRQIQTYAR
jgi:pimeloyl-ACP methyl ester carboxylesterase